MILTIYEPFPHPIHTLRVIRGLCLTLFLCYPPSISSYTFMTILLLLPYIPTLPSCQLLCFSSTCISRTIVFPLPRILYLLGCPMP
ncbi:hypothetical protein FKP32DRAFT_1183518 [Trametes sanguinea]|nr:hypothetical protein FKP32DRAFT_1183518 [Trametes sanguinea]